MIQQPLVNIIIITTNQFDFIGDCIKSLLNCGYGNLKIFCVDNNSKKENYDMFFNKHKYIKEITFFRSNKNLGFAGGCNYALKHIKNGYIVLLNDDTIVTKNWLNPIISYMEEHPEVGACQPKIRDMMRKDYFEYAGAAGGFMDTYGFPFTRGRIFFERERDVGQYDDITDLVWCSGCCFITKADVIKKVGILDEIFFIYAEENDLCWRMNYYGYRLVYIPSSVIYHLGSGTMKKQPSYKSVFLHHRNGLILLLKNYNLFQILRFLPGRMVFDFFAFWYYILHDRIVVNALAVIAAYVNLIFLLPKILKGRKNAAFKHKSWKSIPYPLYRGSIVVDYFLLRKRKFSQLKF